ncbi:MAG: PEP-CTERM sorting domain-containing protein [Verrucomicrobiota bacterium]|jgi:hypothetical protein
MKTTNKTVAAAVRSNARAVLILAAAALAGMGPAVGARAQGSVELDNSQSTGWVTFDGPARYTGLYGVEVWELNADVVPPGINPVNPYGSPYAPVSYTDMENAGFRKEATFHDQTMLFPGTIQLGEVDMPNVAPAGASVVIALAVWDSAAPTFSDILDAYAHGKLGAGVVAFVNPTANYTAFPKPPPPPLSGWTSDLVMTVDTVPEPSAFLLAGAGAAAWLLLRRHRNQR